MKSPYVQILASVAVLAVMTPSLAKDRRSAEPGAAKVKAVLNYDKDGAAAADTFYKALDAHSGRVIHLTLEIVPRQDAASPGYELSLDPPPAGEAEKILCGNGNYGIVDNYRSTYSLSFQHPDHFHAPAEIKIGNRATHPFQAVWCGVEDYSSKELTHLHLSGDFVVMSADIPTAVSYVLYPY